MATRPMTEADLLRPAFVDAIEQFQAQGITDPCTSVPLETLQELEIDQLCAALVENDLTTLLETQVDYPIEFCHSDERPARRKLNHKLK